MTFGVGKLELSGYPKVKIFFEDTVYSFSQNSRMWRAGRQTDQSNCWTWTWSNFLDPTQPDPQVKWPNPIRPRSNMKLWTRPINCRILQLVHPMIFTARRVCIARTMQWRDVCLSVRLSVCYTPVLSLNCYTYDQFFYLRVAPPF